MGLLQETAPEVVIRPPRGWEMVDFKELGAYREVFFFLIWRDLKARYAQSIMGFSWALINPVVQIAVFTIIFGHVAKLPSDGIPYALFSAMAIVPWTYMSDAMSTSSSSLISGSGMLGKVYIPRVVYPLVPVLAKLVDFSISLIVLAAVMVYYSVEPTWNMLYLPFFVLLMMIIPAGIGFWLASLAIRFRDVRFAMPFVIRMLIYSAPILYSASQIPDAYRFLYSLNPIVAVVEGYRACLLGTAMPWMQIVPGVVVALLVLLTGLVYFRKMERVVVDVI